MVFSAQSSLCQTFEHHLVEPGEMHEELLKVSAVLAGLVAKLLDGSRRNDATVCEYPDSIATLTDQGQDV